MTSVDGFVAAVPTANRDKFRWHAEVAAVVFNEHGALKVVECWGDDVADGKVTSLLCVKRKEDETVIFFWVIWPSRRAMPVWQRSWPTRGCSRRRTRCSSMDSA